MRALARHGAMRGKEIAKACGRKIVAGHVYILIQRLRRRGAVECHRMIGNPERGGPKVPVWRITARGRVAIKAMDMLEKT